MILKSHDSDCRFGAAATKTMAFAGAAVKIGPSHLLAQRRPYLEQAGRLFQTHCWSALLLVAPRMLDMDARASRIALHPQVDSRAQAKKLVYTLKPQQL